jgi:2-polyprenyl-3-methyl-5-hydroxy-6-metoxy-1,4-benzoquinol methylase
VQDDAAPVLVAEGEPFDVVVSTEVVEHLFSPHLLPVFARLIVRMGGYLVISTPYHGYLKNLAMAIVGNWDVHHTALCHGGHIKFWSRKTLTQLLEANGFQVKEFHGVGRLPWLWKSMILVARAS